MASTSGPISVTITPEPSTTVLSVNNYNPITGASVSGQSIPYGSVIVADARIEGAAEGTSTQGLATGKVTFSNGGTTVATANVGSLSTASWPSVNATLTIFAPGSYNYTAAYSGDASCNSSTSAAVPFTIAKGVTTVTLNLPSMVYGIYGSYYPVGIPRTIRTPYNLGLASTGTVAITIDGQSAGTINSFTAVPQGSGSSETWLISTGSSIANNLFAPGSNAITVIYSGDANYAPSTANATIYDSDGVGSFAMTPSGNLPLVAGQTGIEAFTLTPSGVSTAMCPSRSPASPPECTSRGRSRMA